MLLLSGGRGGFLMITLPILLVIELCVARTIWQAHRQTPMNSPSTKYAGAGAQAFYDCARRFVLLVRSMRMFMFLCLSKSS